MPPSSFRKFLRAVILPQGGVFSFFAKVIALTLWASVVIGLVAGGFLFNEFAQLEGDGLETIINWKGFDNTIIFDRKGGKLAEGYSRHHVYYPLSKIPEDLQKAVVAVEDRNFWKHDGWDLEGIARAAYIYLQDPQAPFKQGASTITQQLVRHFLLHRDKTITRKAQEILLARQLEKRLPKRRILEIYLNALFLGDGAYGVGAAAERFFGKSLENCQTHELALIAGLFQAPSALNPHLYPEKAKARQAQVLRAMTAIGALAPSQARTWLGKNLEYQTYEPLYGQRAPYFVDFAMEEARNILDKGTLKNQGLRIITSLDPDLQKLAEQASLEQNASLEDAEKQSSHRLESALLALDPRTGEILAMVGGRDYSASQFNRTSQAKRQAGSAFKPIVYSLALSKGHRWSDLFFVSPLTLGQSYRPRSKVNDYISETTLLRALYRSMNSPTLQLSETLGMGAIIEHAKLLGIESPIRHEFGSVLGASEVSLLEITSVYGVFANKGLKVPSSSILEIRDRNDKIIFHRSKPKAENVLSPQVAFMMSQGLRQVLERGTGSAAKELAPWMAGKTGTTNDNKDNWFIGFSSNLVTGVWVGNDDSQPIIGKASGADLALPLWQSFMTEVLPMRPSSPFRSPGGLKAYTVDERFGFQNKDGITMWFFENDEPPKTSPYEYVTGTKNFRNPFVGVRK